MLKGAAHGETQVVFQSLALDILRDVGRPMKSTEFIEEFRKRGHPLGGNEVRTAWNRLWEGRKNGVLSYVPKLGYWIAGEPLSKEAEKRALIAAKQTRRRKRDGPSLVALGRGKPKGPPSALTAEQVAAAEKMLLAGQSLTEVAAFFGVAIRTLALRLPGGGLGGLKAKYPNVVIPKRPYVYRPPKPGHRPLGRPRTITDEQDKQIADVRAEGLSMQKIADALGLKRSTVYASLARQEREADRKKEDDAVEAWVRCACYLIPVRPPVFRPAGDHNRPPSTNAPSRHRSVPANRRKEGLPRAAAAQITIIVAAPAVAETPRHTH